MSFEYILGFGGNLKFPPLTFKNAIKDLEEKYDVTLIQASSLYLTPPLPGSQGVDWYWNQILAVSTSMVPLELLTATQQVEKRKATIGKWGEDRELDIDLIYSKDHTSNTAQLSLPHKQAWLRNFVLLPLAEIDPKLVAENSLLDAESLVRDIYRVS